MANKPSDCYSTHTRVQYFHQKGSHYVNCRCNTENLAKLQKLYPTESLFPDDLFPGYKTQKLEVSESLIYNIGDD